MCPRRDRRDGRSAIVLQSSPGVRRRTMNRRDFLKAFGAGVAACAAAGTMAAAEARDKRKPNIVLIFVDDLSGVGTRRY